MYGYILTSTRRIFFEMIWQILTKKPATQSPAFNLINYVVHKYFKRETFIRETPSNTKQNEPQQENCPGTVSNKSKPICLGDFDPRLHPPLRFKTLSRLFGWYGELLIHQWVIAGNNWINVKKKHDETKMRTRLIQRVETAWESWDVNTTGTLEQKTTTSWTQLGEETNKYPAPINQIFSCILGAITVWTSTNQRAIK